jgi:hypothetical protein
VPSLRLGFGLPVDRCEYSGDVSVSDSAFRNLTIRCDVIDQVPHEFSIAAVQPDPPVDRVLSPNIPMTA